MSIADRCVPRNLRGSRGFTALETMITLVLVSAMALVIQKTLSTADNAARYMKAIQTATERGHNLSYDIREYVTSSRRIFFDDAVGEGFRDALDLTAFPPVAASRLPMVDEEGRLGPDPADTPMTGNFLLFAGEADATSVVSDPAAGLKRHIDTYRFHAIYVHQSNRMVVVEAGGQNALDLVVWESVEFPNYQQIAGILDDTERGTVIRELVNDHGHTMAWDPAGSIDGSFYVLGADGSLAIAPSLNVTIGEHPADSRGGRLVYADTQLARTDMQDARRKAIFATADPENWLPDGFEVKVVGRSGSRQVWIHLVTEVQATQGATATHASTLIMATKDL